jgi:hypothetical protein
MPTGEKPRRLELAVFLAVVAFTYGSITRGLEDGNTWSRMGLVFSVVERHVLNLRPFVLKHFTNDWSWYEREIYSNKAPAPALLMLDARLEPDRRLPGVRRRVDGRGRMALLQAAGFAPGRSEGARTGGAEGRFVTEWGLRER